MGIFDNLTPIRPSAELAGVSGLLSAFAERRMKQQQAEVEREFRERQFAAQQENQRIDNARQDRLATGTLDNYERQAQAEKDKVAREADYRALDALGVVSKDNVLEQDPTRASGMLRAGGGQLTNYTPTPQKVPDMPAPPQEVMPELPLGLDAGMSRVLNAPDQARYDQELGARSAVESGNAARAADAEERGLYNYKLPSGQSMTLSRFGSETGRLEKAARDFDLWNKVQVDDLPPEHQNIHFQLGEFLRNGMMDIKEATKQFNLQTGQEKQRAQSQVNAEMQATRRPDPTLVNKQRKQAIQANYMNEARKVADSYGLKEHLKNVDELERLNVLGLGAEDNSAMAAMLKGMFAHKAQGAGVLSDNDLKVFWNTIGGLRIRSWQAFKDQWDGELSSGKVGPVRQAIEGLAWAADMHEWRMGAAIVQSVSKMDEGGRAELPRILQTLAPGYWEELQRRKAEKAAKQGKAAPPPGSTAAVPLEISQPPAAAAAPASQPASAYPPSQPGLAGPEPVVNSGTRGGARPFGSDAPGAKKKPGSHPLKPQASDDKMRALLDSLPVPAPPSGPQASARGGSASPVVAGKHPEGREPGARYEPDYYKDRVPYPSPEEWQARGVVRPPTRNEWTNGFSEQEQRAMTEWLAGRGPNPMEGMGFKTTPKKGRR